MAMATDNSKMSESPGASMYGNPASGFGQGPPYQSTQQLMYNNQLQSVMVTQATSSLVRTVPTITLALVLNTLGALFCGFWCGAAGIIMAWKARLQEIKQRHDEANHTLKISWLFLLLSFLFGILIWAMAGYYINLVIRPRYYG